MQKNPLTEGTIKGGITKSSAEQDHKKPINPPPAPRPKEMLEKEDEAYKKLIDSIKHKLKELEQSQLDIDEYLVGLMKIAVESRKQLKEGENI